MHPALAPPPRIELGSRGPEPRAFSAGPRGRWWRAAGESDSASRRCKPGPSRKERLRGAGGENRTRVVGLEARCLCHSATPASVDPAGLEPALLACRARVLPLDYEPIVEPPPRIELGSTAFVALCPETTGTGACRRQVSNLLGRFRRAAVEPRHDGQRNWGDRRESNPLRRGPQPRAQPEGFGHQRRAESR